MRSSERSGPRIDDRLEKTVRRQRPASKPAPLGGLSILAVDDDMHALEILSEALRRAGAVVWQAVSAREALEQLARQLPDIVLSDIGMPDEDGCVMLSRIRALPTAAGGALPAIAVTGYARPEDLAAARSAGYQAVVTKPVEFYELSHVILELTGRA